ncbi:hypothetical protein PJO54_29295 [Mycobacterium kansasii]
MKKYFDGSVVPDNPRMTSSQKSIRTNDIENVGSSTGTSDALGTIV